MPCHIEDTGNADITQSTLSNRREHDARQIKKQDARLIYRKPGEIKEAIISRLTNASHGASDELYRQSSVLCGLEIARK